MEILEAYDLVGTYRGAAELAGCDHHTVKHYGHGSPGCIMEADKKRINLEHKVVKPGSL